jgi:hypothetical protein
MVRLAHDEPSIPLKDREGTISTPFRKIFAIICLSPVVLRLFSKKPFALQTLSAASANRHSSSRWQILRNLFLNQCNAGTLFPSIAALRQHPPRRSDRRQQFSGSRSAVLWIVPVSPVRKWRREALLSHNENCW